MIDISMSQKEIQEFLSKPLIARIATVGKDLTPNVHPVWFLYDGEFIYISTGKFSAKVRNIIRNPKVAVVVD
ncbi:MAG: pyridoxamine 5'-phosphate oxidase family protein, partial [Archaeoglobaceae archaeon]